MPRAAGAGLDLATSLLRAPRERYTVRALADTVMERQTVRRLTLTPRTSDAPFRTAELWIAPEDALIYRLVVAEPLGLVRTIDFSRVRVGVAIPDSAFVFTAPDGVRVIDQAALLGGSVPTKRP
jgi:outer membrane lipoprotein-sorting protein